MTRRLALRRLVQALPLVTACFGALGCRSASTSARDEEPTTTATSIATQPQRAPAPLARTELPGMVIELPDPAVVNGDYLTGSVQHDAGPLEWAVTWQRGVVPPADALGRIVTNMAQAMDRKLLSTSTRIRSSRDVAFAEGTGHQYELANDAGFAALVTFGECGGRVVQVIAGGTSATLRATNDRIVASFRCAADAGAPARSAVVLDARAGWRLATAKGELLANERHVLVRPDSIPDTSTLPMGEIVLGAARAAGFRVDAAPARVRGDRTLWSASLPMDGGTRPAAILAWRCAARHAIAVVYVMSAAGAPLDDGIDLAFTARCREAG